jgi:O-succinylbenzoic acid--CoA ligase
MDELLSVRAAAREAGDAWALRVDGGAYAYRELASLVETRMRALDHETRARRPHALVADNTLASVVDLFALLELRVPALLVHPKLTRVEREALLEQAAEAGDVGPADAAVIIHTSGTTGTPRGAVLTRRALLASAAASAANLGWRDDECWFACMPIARVGGLSILTRSLAARRCVALADRFDAAAFPAQLDDARATLASLVPTMLARVLDEHPSWRPPSRLRCVLVGGMAASPRLLARAAERGIPVVLTYGMTETCSQVVATPYDDRFAPSRRGDGRPLPGVELRIVDGRIEVRGPMLMAGYWTGPALEAGAWLDTGDLGGIDPDGCLHMHARRTDLIVTGGENVYPAEVERVLEQCPGVAEAAVFGVPDETWGATVAAALVTDGRRPLPEAELHAFARTRLASHKRPRHLCFVERLPHTAGGKLDRTALAALVPSLRRAKATAA